MRLIDKIRYAFKNISKEGSKSILTIFITFILFSLLTSIVVIGTSFYSSINNTYNQLLDDNKLYINCNIVGNVSNEMFEKTKSLYYDCEYVSEVKSYLGKVTLYDYDYLKIENVNLNDAKNKNYVF